jgi:hypothetical protein
MRPRGRVYSSKIARRGYHIELGKTDGAGDEPDARATGTFLVHKLVTFMCSTLLFQCYFNSYFIGILQLLQEIQMKNTLLFLCLQLARLDSSCKNRGVSYQSNLLCPFQLPLWRD